MIEIGVDIVEIPRIAQMTKKRRFLNRVFTKDEVSYCAQRKNSAQHYAVRFAAKEAVWKAISSEVARMASRGKVISHRDIQVRNRADGKPEIFFPAHCKRLAKRVSISLSHGREYAVAMAVYDPSLS